MSRTDKLLLLVIFLTAVLLRLGLITVNREANDNHMFSIRFTLVTNKLAKWEHCGECFQPKLYHYTAAKLIKWLEIDKDDRDRQTVASQGINLVAGIVHLAVLWLFIHQIPIGNVKAKILTFALASLNPTLTSINAQATNDTLVITFGAVAFYFAYRFLKTEGWLNLLLTMLFSFLAVSAKSNGWVMVIAIFGTFLIQAVMHPNRRIYSLLTAVGYIGIVVAAAFLNPLNQYAFNYQKYGSPLIVNVRQQPPLPHFFEETSFPEAGVLSIQDGFFTFKFVELLQHPYSPCEDPGPSVCTSLWTQLYARNHSTTFFKYPPTWIIDSPLVYGLDRSIFIFALPVSLLFVYGVWKSVFAISKTVWRKESMPEMVLTVLVILGYVGFIILYSVLYRKISFMKPIFLYPGYLAFILVFLQSLHDLENKVQRKIIVSMFYVVAALLVVLYALNSFSLYGHLLGLL